MAWLWAQPALDKARSTAVWPERYGAWEVLPVLRDVFCPVLRLVNLGTERAFELLFVGHGRPLQKERDDRFAACHLQIYINAAYSNSFPHFRQVTALKGKAKNF